MSALKGVPPEKKFPRDTEQDGTVKDSKAKAPPRRKRGRYTYGFNEKGISENITPPSAEFKGKPFKQGWDKQQLDD